MSKDASFNRTGRSLAAGPFAAPPSAAARGDVAPDPQSEFIALMTRVSEGWTKQHTDLALSAFADDALYTEPPNLQIYRGVHELRIFFDRISSGATMKWQQLWYDEATGCGAGEYSFKNGGRDTAAHGVAIVEVRNGKIKSWREYQRRGDIAFEDFHNPDGKVWQTTVGDL